VLGDLALGALWLPAQVAQNLSYGFGIIHNSVIGS
jgi:hypothetical protein